MTTIRHNIVVRKYNREPGYRQGGAKRFWWADCSCGMYQGFHHKGEAQAWKCPRALRGSR